MAAVFPAPDRSSFGLAKWRIRAFGSCWTPLVLAKCVAAPIICSVLLGGCASLTPLPVLIDGGVQSGSIVVVQGYVSLEFEGQSIHESQADCESGNNARALWVDIRRKDIPAGWRNCSLGQVAGVYRPDDTGHFGMWPAGALVTVSTVRAIRK